MKKDNGRRHFRITFLLVTFAAIAVTNICAQETAQQVLSRSAAAYRDQWTSGRIQDWVANGKIIVTGSGSGPQDFSLMVKRGDKVRRIIQTAEGGEISCGSDGSKSWYKSGPHVGDAAGQMAHIIASQSSRSMASLFSGNNTLKDLGPADKQRAPESKSARIIEAKNDKGQTTRFYVDTETSLINRLEFETGTTYRMPFGDKEYPSFASFVFSDYREVDGNLTPFRIEVYEGLVKVEEMNITSIDYNKGISDDVFVP